MKIKWYGHAAFLITSDQGVKIITDPYEPGAFGGQLSYGKITDQADIVLVSHDHADHNYTKDLPGSPQIVKGSGSKTSKGISIKGIATFHDPSKGSERGANTVFTFKVDGIQVCHLGDLGHVLSQKEMDGDRSCGYPPYPCGRLLYHRRKRGHSGRRADETEGPDPDALQDGEVRISHRAG